MEEKKPEVSTVTITPQETDRNITDLNYLVGTILDYYMMTSGSSVEEGEEWKKLSDQYKSENPVPDKIHDSIQKTFIHQLKRFQE